MIPESMTQRVETLRTIVSKGDNCDQELIDSILTELESHREALQPEEKDEPFLLVDRSGGSRSVIAPRWLCHLLGLRHRAVHILIRWESPGLGSTAILQVRSWDKIEYPGHLDLSATGHSQLHDQSGLSAAYRELKEELGLSRVDLDKNGLHHVAAYENTDSIPGRLFLNVEWRDLYEGLLNTNALTSLRFNDREVIALFLCPIVHAHHLLQQSAIPLAESLRRSLPVMLYR